MTTPPGWYPDPGHPGHGPLLERWWDGSAWTDYTREPQGAVTARIPSQQPDFGPPRHPGTFHQSPAFPGYEPGYEPLPPRDGGSRGKVIAFAAVAGVLVAAIVGGIVLLNTTEGGAESADSKPGAGSDRRPGPGESDGPAAPGKGARTAPDEVNGISLPVLDGWRAGRSGSGGAAVTTGAYPCPGDRDVTCVRGGAFSHPALSSGRTAEKIAKADIEKNAEESYGADPESGKEVYGGITGHKELKSTPVTVAGEKGYLVRWKVETEHGQGGYVQSLVFTSPVTKDFVLVRFGFDAGGQAPPPADMDRITKGIAPLRAGADGGAV
ncbi:DUF2510 domain-containing protein [Streptomyces pathocidini]|uniref:DUF2510 domain-containing protein n=1 Tax=Streptomyces pathocidini TaxID=1650571 RepID=A0ABW7UTL0_9ACTN|nr:DUF2510 domain-containing protein [Streptomyces pathocidini]